MANISCSIYCLKIFSLSLSVSQFSSKLTKSNTYKIFGHVQVEAEVVAVSTQSSGAKVSGDFGSGDDDESDERRSKKGQEGNWKKIRLAATAARAATFVLIFTRVPNRIFLVSANTLF